jgi:cytochrome c-type protein NapC
MLKLITSIKDLIVSVTARFPLTVTFSLFVSGILFWGAFNWSLELTNTESFCVSCHEMSDNILPEYKKSVHFLNVSGVRATCPDCHVPKKWVDKVVRKVGATNELMHKVLGSIDTREKFLTKRMTLASYVWDTMKSNDSLECRNCHELTFMAAASTNNKAHARAVKSSMTCIDCHKGIAHELPIGFVEAEHARYDSEGTNCGNCHANLEYLQEDWDDET